MTAKGRHPRHPTSSPPTYVISTYLRHSRHLTSSPPPYVIPATLRHLHLLTSSPPPYVISTYLRHSRHLTSSPPPYVIPAQAGIHSEIDSRLRGNDDKGSAAFFTLRARRKRPVQVASAQLVEPLRNQVQAWSAKHKKGHPWGWPFLCLVGRAGFEPATNWLKANCSTN